MTHTPPCDCITKEAGFWTSSCYCQNFGSCADAAAWASRANEFRRFHNALRIMHNIGRDDLLQAGIQLDDGQWANFEPNPYRWFFRASDQHAHELWGIIQEGQRP